MTTGRVLSFKKIFSNDDIRVVDISSSYPGAYAETDYNRFPCISFPVESFYCYQSNDQEFVVDSTKVIVEKNDVPFSIKKDRRERADKTYAIQIINTASSLYENVLALSKNVQVGQRDPVFDIQLYLALQNTNLSDRSVPAWQTLALNSLAGLSAADCKRVSYYHAKKIEVAKQVMLGTFDEGECTVERIASEVALSSFHFIRLFKRATGVSPYQFLLKIRMEAAKICLRRGASTTESAFIVGFNSLENFCYCFRRLVGVSPGEFRMRNNSKSSN